MDRTAIASRIAGILTDTGLAQDFDVVNDGAADVAVVGVRTALQRRDVNLDAGLAGHYQFSVCCAAAELASATLDPRRTKVRSGAALYRLLAVDADPLGASIRLHLGGLLQ